MINSNFDNGPLRRHPRFSTYVETSPRPRFASQPHNFLLNYIDTTFQMADPAGSFPDFAKRPRSGV
jgi:hypothetical protein